MITSSISRGINLNETMVFSSRYTRRQHVSAVATGLAIFAKLRLCLGTRAMTGLRREGREWWHMNE